MNHEQQELMLKEYQLTKSVSLRNKIVEANLKLVDHQLSKYAYSPLKEELRQEGCIGLIKCVERFDLNKGYKFSTYAVMYIRGAMQDYNKKYDTYFGIRRKSIPQQQIAKVFKDLNIEDLTDKMIRDMCLEHQFDYHEVMLALTAKAPKADFDIEWVQSSSLKNPAVLYELIEDAERVDSYLESVDDEKLYIFTEKVLHEHKERDIAAAVDRSKSGVAYIAKTLMQEMIDNFAEV